MYSKYLIIGTGQIGKAVLEQILKLSPNTIIIHNLTKKESELVIKNYSKKYKKVNFIESYGNIFMPYSLKDLNNKNLYEKSKEIIKYFYSEMSEEIISEATITAIIRKYKPDIIIDAINTATVLGNAWNPEETKKLFNDNKIDCCEKIMVDDYTTKIVNFVYSLKYSMEEYQVIKYIKVSTTGLGGMGINMPYTHGDNPKMQLSSALVGKISASGVLHQLLWNLSHTNGIDVSLVVPATFVGYDSVLSEPIETEKGLLIKRKVSKPKKIENGNELKYSNSLEKKYLQFPVVRAGENHVYSKLELEVLTAIGQMEAITKEEVAKEVINNLLGKTNKDIFSQMDNAMLTPTYAGKNMVNKICEEIEKQSIENNELGIATGNLGVKLSKQLYELSLIKSVCPTVNEVRQMSTSEITDLVNKKLDEQWISEIITLGIPIITDKNEFFIGDYSLVPTLNESKTINNKNIKRWSKIGWVDLRKQNITMWIKIILELNEIIKDIDYKVADYLAFYYNKNNKGRKK